MKRQRVPLDGIAPTAYVATMTEKTAKPISLREACVQEALAIIETSGVEELSLRQVARRLGVSHQAPYKHFPSRDHILAEIVARAFESFADYLDDCAKNEGQDLDLGYMGEAYLRYAHAHPLQYRLMFGTPLPNPADHPAMMQNAQHAFSLLTDALRQRRLQRGDDHAETAILMDAMFIWSTLHGLASLSSSHAVDTIGLPKHLIEDAAMPILTRIGRAIGKDD
ncbi:MAG: TetR/AcrR family transcriptional regulator [Pseudomonadota bacterium]